MRRLLVSMIPWLSTYRSSFARLADCSPKLTTQKLMTLLSPSKLLPALCTSAATRMMEEIDCTEQSRPLPAAAQVRFFSLLIGVSANDPAANTDLDVLRNSPSQLSIYLTRLSSYLRQKHASPTKPPASLRPSIISSTCAFHHAGHNRISFCNQSKASYECQRSTKYRQHP